MIFTYAMRTRYTLSVLRHALVRLAYTRTLNVLPKVQTTKMPLKALLNYFFYLGAKMQNNSIIGSKLEVPRH